MAGEAVDLPFELGDPVRELARQLHELGPVDLDAVALHGRDHGYERALDGLVDRGHPFPGQPRLEMPPQGKGDVRVLGRIVAGLLQRHQVEGDLRLARARDRLVGNRLALQQELGDGVHLVLVAAAFEHIGEQHGVVDRRHLDAVAAQHHDVVFEVVADLEHGGVGKQRRQSRQHPIEPELPRHLVERVAWPVAEGDVAAGAGRDAHGNADQTGAHLVDRCGLGVDGDDAAGTGGGVDPAPELRLVLDELVAGRDGAFAVAGRRGFGGGAEPGLDPGGQRAELLGAQEPDEGVGPRRPARQPVQALAHRHMAVERDQAPGEARHLGVFEQVLAPLGLPDLARPPQQRLQIAIVVDELGRRLDADARHARHVVDRIAGQGLDLDHLVGSHAELLHHLGGADLPVLQAVEHDHAVLDELHQVLVRGDDRHPGAGLAGEPGIGRDDVVGLVALDLDDRQVEGAGGLADERELRHQLRRRVRPVGLVFGIDVVAEAPGAVVEDAGDAVRVGAVDELEQHAAETHHRIDRRAVAARHRRQGVEGAEDEPGTVDQGDVSGGVGHDRHSSGSTGTFERLRRPSRSVADCSLERLGGSIHRARDRRFGASDSSRRRAVRGRPGLRSRSTRSGGRNSRSRRSLRR